jgi:hypothetical protein
VEVAEVDIGFSGCLSADSLDRFALCAIGI